MISINTVQLLPSIVQGSSACDLACFTGEHKLKLAVKLNLLNNSQSKIVKSVAVTGVTDTIRGGVKTISCKQNNY